MKLKTSIDDGKKDAVTKKNKILTETESQLSKLDYRLGSCEGEVIISRVFYLSSVLDLYQ